MYSLGRDISDDKEDAAVLCTIFPFLEEIEEAAKEDAQENRGKSALDLAALQTGAGVCPFPFYLDDTMHACAPQGLDVTSTNWLKLMRWGRRVIAEDVALLRFGIVLRRVRDVSLTSPCA